MVKKVVFAVRDTQLWEKLDAMTAIDPAATGGIRNVIMGHRSFAYGDRLVSNLTSGFDEIHSIEDGFCAHVTDASMDEGWRVTASGRDHNLRLRLAFAGEADYFAHDSRVTDETAHCSFFIRPAGEELTARFVGGTHYRYCSLNLTRDYLLDALGLEPDELPSMLLDHWDRRETVMGHFPVSKSSLAQAGRFFYLKSLGAWRDLEIRTIAMSLLRMLFDDWRNASGGVNTFIRITPGEREKLLRIKTLIEENPTGSYTLPTLCGKVRLNRNKVHYGFKRLFGVSVRQFQVELRMQMALKLLESTELPIAEVAERAGFSEPTNFTAAFKNHFAVLPKHVRDR